MSCGCKKTPKKPLRVITGQQPTPEPIKVPQTPEELHAQEITEWNGGFPKNIAIILKEDEEQ